MLGFAFRLLSLVALVLAVVTATMDSIESVSSSEVVLTPLGMAWSQMSPMTLALAQAQSEQYIGTWFWNDAAMWFLRQPTFAVFLGLSLLSWMIGYRKPKAAGRFAA
ncbi:MAG: hypothetical protein ACOH2J_12260 [Allorhizobium sp.]